MIGILEPLRSGPCRKTPVVIVAQAMNTDLPRLVNGWISHGCLTLNYEHESGGNGGATTI